MLTIISIGELRNFDTLSIFTFQLNTLPQKKNSDFIQIEAFKIFLFKVLYKKRLYLILFNDLIKASSAPIFLMAKYVNTIATKGVIMPIPTFSKVETTSVLRFKK